MIEKEPEHQLIPDFIPTNDATTLFDQLESQVDWDTSIKARKTACYGETYDESGVDYEIQPMHRLLEPVCKQIEEALSFLPTNCLLNYYADGKSTMGFHSDTTSNLAEGTGIVIISLGTERNITFRKIEDYDVRHTYLLPHGSLFYMTQRTQDYWHHAVKKANTDQPRISITFRRILADLKILI